VHHLSSYCGNHNWNRAGLHHGWQRHVVPGEINKGRVCAEVFVSLPEIDRE
jgi:hypothetical protein